MTFVRAVSLGLLALVCFPAPALPHAERDVPSPNRPGALPDEARVNPNQLVVCKPESRPTEAQHAAILLRLAINPTDPEALADEAAWQRNDTLISSCTFSHIQAAVHAAGDDTDILVMPGTYYEEPSRAAPTTSSGDLPGGAYSYAYHVANPNDANLIAILGKKNITLEGTGARPSDVVVDAGYVKDVGIRCDKCEGFIVRNLTERAAPEHGIYVIDSDGYIYDRVVGSYNLHYALFAFASDHGLFKNSEAVGGGDSGFYVGAAPDSLTCQGGANDGVACTEPSECPGGACVCRINTVLTNVTMRHNALGFSGTNGNCVRIENSDIYDNAIGISFDSEEAGHDNYPQKGAQIVNNRIHDNNFDVYGAWSDVPVIGPGYDFVHYPVGSGMWIAPGYDNLTSGNYFWNNNRYGALLIAFGQSLTSPHGNRSAWRDNFMGITPESVPAPNGTDFWWDTFGEDNCWQDNGPFPITSDPPTLPDCSAPNSGPEDPDKVNQLVSCIIVDPETGEVLSPSTCPFGSGNFAYAIDHLVPGCGNGVLDPGEDCDGAYGRDVGDATCGAEGHSGGTLACNPDCTFDYSGCTVPACTPFIEGRTTLKKGTTPTKATIKARGLPTVGHVFDPLSDEFEVFLRYDGKVFYSGFLPSGTTWTTSGATPPGKYTYKDPAGTYDGIVKATLRRRTDGTLSAMVKVVGLDLDAAGTSPYGRAVIRFGGDCWEQRGLCAASKSGRNVRCQSQ